MPVPVSAAEQRLRDAVARRPSDPEPHLELARYYDAQGRAAQAVWEYQEAVAVRPEAVSNRLLLAASLGGLRLPELAIPMLEALVRRPSLPADARRALAEFYLITGRLEDAVSVLAADAKGAGVSPPALLSLGRANLALGRLPAAEAAFRGYQRRSPGSAEGCYWLGRVAAASGRASAARALWEKGAELAPSDLRFLYELGMSYAEDRAPGSAERAERALEEALRRSPGFAPALVQKGRLLERRGRHREAAEQFLAAIRAAPADPEPQRGLAESLAALGETAQADRHRGFYYAFSERPARAAEAFARFQAARPDAVEGPLLVSQAYIQMQQNERAAGVVAAALRRHPGAPELYESLATLYLMTLSGREAAASCEAWRREQPEAARPYWLLGRVALSQQRVGEAVRQFEAALAREPNEAAYAAALGGALARQSSASSRQRALELLRRAVALKPDAPEYCAQLGALLQQAGELGAAREEYLAALNRDPGQLGAYNGLVQISQRLRKPGQVALWAGAMRVVRERAREEMRLRRQAGVLPRDAAACYALATMLLRAGNVRAAQGQLEEAVELRPGWSEVRRLLARVKAVRSVM